MYDQFGSKVLSSGFDRGEKIAFGGYKYKRNAFEIFEEFHKTYLPFNKLFDKEGTELHGSFFGGAMGGMKFDQTKVCESISLTVECSIEDFFNGAIKIVKFGEGQSKRVEVKPGYRDGTELNFKDEVKSGDQRADLKITLKDEKSSSQFKRVGDNLVYTHKINIIEAINSAPIKF